MAAPAKIASAYWISPRMGWVQLTTPCESGLPPLRLEAGDISIEAVRPAAPALFGRYSGYYVTQGMVHFLVYADEHPFLEWPAQALYVAGEFNGWANAIGREEWRMLPEEDEGRRCFRLSVALHRCTAGDAVHFKFVTGDRHWLAIPPYAPNVCFDATGISNYQIDPARTGDNAFVFEVNSPRAILGDHTLVWEEPHHVETRQIQSGPFFYKLGTDLPMGARVRIGRTTFRLFAPRATSVRVEFFRELGETEPEVAEMTLADCVTWEVTVPRNLHGWYYHYKVEGLNKDASTAFKPDLPLVDPWALVVVSATGPGMVWDEAQSPPPPAKPFVPPKWQDLVIAEAHVRDLIAKTPLGLTATERLGFSGLAKWVRASDNYLESLGVNCVELQPIQQCDSRTRDEYHWGYMTTNYFSPSAWYATNPVQGSQVAEFRDVVEAFHEKGIAVILDVVYNHVGEPPYLVHIDKQYYFDLDDRGELMNWSGCGNTLRCNTPMARRLLVESLRHLVTTYDVDGFRFDLAELVGKEVLLEIEDALKRIKPGIILVAEPWSFRGHIARDLKDTGYAFWNDGYRDFLPDYVRGHGNQDGIRYFLGGSLSHLCSFPAQSVNYTESHDDYCWIDRICENDTHNAEHPTHNDRVRTHLMFAILLSSIGVPMLSAGQDFLRSKRGIHNTYLMGDVNALDYHRLERFRHTHDYVRAWIRFRLSPEGQALRLWSRPRDDYMRTWTAHGYSAIAALYNNDRSYGETQILFAVNPHQDSVCLSLGGLCREDFVQLADIERFDPEGLHTDMFDAHGQLLLPPMSCGLWISKKNA